MFANQSYLKINSENDVDLQNILNDYINNFCDGYFEVKVKHKNVQKFKLSFQTNNLPHLLGLHYTQKEKINAKKIVGRIAEGKITKNSIKRHHEYSKIKDRLKSSPDSCVKCYTMFLPFLLIKIDVFS